MVFELTEHHFIAKKQSEFLRVKKVSLKFDEAVLILDFAENYSFVVQDYAQSYPSLCCILFESRDKRN